MSSTVSLISNTNSINRVLPHSIETEQSVLGGVMLDPHAWDKVAHILSSKDFFSPVHSYIFSAMTLLSLQGQPLDPITVSENISQQLNALSEAKLERLQDLKHVGGLAYLSDLVRNTPSAANIVAYANIVRQYSILRKVIQIGGDMVETGFASQGRPIDEVLDEFETKIFAIAKERNKSERGPRKISDVLANTMDQISSYCEQKSAVTGLQTPFVDFDRLTSGLQPSDFIVIAGRPSMGKTALAMNIAECVAITTEKTVLVFSLEMPAESLAMRLLASLSRVEQQRLRTGDLHDSDWPLVSSAVKTISERKLVIDDSNSLSPMEIRSRARRVANEYGQLGLIVIDYLQLLHVKGYRENRSLEISEISRSLKSLARELNVPVLALSQLNRSLENRPDKRPMMSDLRECVVGETLVHLADGSRVPISELENKTVSLFSIDKNQNLCVSPSANIWKVGDKPTYTVRLASGREITATAEHLLYESKNWKKISDLVIGDKLGVIDENKDLAWESIDSITPAGMQTVYDLTVPGHANWLANDNIISHNSGAIEQDADLIAFIYRDEVYNKETEHKGRAELIISKQRNGPIGTVMLTFLGQFSKFESYAAENGPPPWA